jgi:hypothetical protein
MQRGLAALGNPLEGLDVEYIAQNRVNAYSTEGLGLLLPPHQGAHAMAALE